MKRLKIISQYKYLIVTILLIIYSIILNNCIDIKSKYNINDNTIQGYIGSYIIDGNKLTMKITAKEKIICIYYFPNEEDIITFKNKYKLGDVILLNGSIEKPSNNTVFNLFNYKEYLKYEGINYIFKVDKITKISDNKMIRYKIKNMIVNFIEKNSNKKYLYAFILNNGKYIDSDIVESYRINGIIHLFSVSGANISLISLIILKLFDKFKFKNIIVIIILFLYMFLTDFSPPVLRAGLMFILLYLNKRFNFKISNINIILILLSVLILIDPYIIYKIGFQYSYIISFYLILFNNLIERYNSKIFKLFIISFISFMASIPITINSFFQINILSIILNIFFVPMISFIIFPLSLIVVIVPILNPLLEILIDIFENLSIYFSKVQFLIFTMSKMNILIALLYYVVITYILYGMLIHKYKRVIILGIILIIHNNINYFNYKKEVMFIDVGQGDSALIKMPYNKSNILIDTGGKDNYYVEDWTEKNNNYSLGKDTVCMYIKSLGINKLDYLILTHGDSDHMGEAINVIDCIDVDNVIFNYGYINDNESNIINVLKSRHINYYFFKENDKIVSYKYQLLFISPSYDYGNENDNSLVIYLNIDNYKFLFTGDAGVENEKDILDKYSLNNIDFLKVGHHGSNTSSCKEFIDNINPKYSFISVGKNNRYGHPKNSVLDILNNSKIYRTDQDGSIEIELNNNGYKIKTCPP